MTMPRFDRPELVTVSKTINRSAIQLYAEITDDFNPIHLDPEFAATTPMRGIIAHGMLSLNLVWQSLRATYGAAAAEGAVLDVRFVRPVRENDVISASGRLQPGSAGAYDVVVTNQKGEPVITGTFTFENIQAG
jgi:3-hydroxybutyryl-CoA dehydratase